MMAMRVRVSVIRRRCKRRQAKPPLDENGNLLEEFSNLLCREKEASSRRGWSLLHSPPFGTCSSPAFGTGQDRGGRTKPRASFLIIFARNHSADEPPEMSPFYLTLMRNTAAASQQASPCAAPSIMCRPILHLHLQRCVKLSKKVLHLSSWHGLTMTGRSVMLSFLSVLYPATSLGSVSLSSEKG